MNFKDKLVPIAGAGFFGMTVSHDEPATIEDLILVSLPALTNAVFLQVDEVNSGLSNDNLALRYKEDGTDPTNSSGFVIGKGDGIELTNIEQIRNTKFTTAEAGVDVLVNIQCYCNG